jgi:hypothetical protein
MKKDQPRVIEQVFPDASILGPQLLVPNLSENQKRIFMQLDFAKEENIKQLEENDRDQRRDVRRQTKQYRDTVREEESIVSDTEIEELSISKIPPDEKTILTEGKNVDIDDQPKDIQSIIVQPSVEKQLSEIKKSPSEEDRAKTKPSIIKENIVEQIDKQITEDELRKPSIKTLPSDQILSIDGRLPSSKSISIVPPNTTKDLLTPNLTES